MVLGNREPVLPHPRHIVLFLNDFSHISHLLVDQPINHPESLSMSEDLRRHNLSQVRYRFVLVTDPAEGIEVEEIQDADYYTFAHELVGLRGVVVWIALLPVVCVAILLRNQQVLI